MEGFSALAFLLFIVIAFRSPLERVLLDTSASVFGLLYIGLALVTIPLIWAQDMGLRCCSFSPRGVDGDLSRSMWAAPSAQTGSQVSPNKTWEGSVASIGGSMLGRCC